MCLSTKQAYPFIAEEEIVCYKLIEKKRNLFGWKWVTPFKGFRVSKSVVSGKRLLRARGRRIYYRHIFGNLIGGGYIHTFSNNEYEKDAYEIMSVAGYHLFECVIPVGTEYYVSDTEQEYASRSIRFVSQIF